MTSGGWLVVVERYMEKMDFPADTQLVAIRHGDTSFDNVHIVANHLSLRQEVWLGQWDARKAIDATQTLERELELTLTPGLADWLEEDPEPRQRNRRAQRVLSRAEREMGQRRGETLSRRKLQDLIALAMKEGASLREFSNRLTRMGVEIQFRLGKPGQITGVSLRCDGVAFKGGPTRGGVHLDGVPHATRG